jgi:hypothetical protein
MAPPAVCGHCPTLSGVYTPPVCDHTFCGGWRHRECNPCMLSSVMSPGGSSVWLRKTIEGRVAVYADETRKNCRAARTDGSLRVPPTCRPRRPRMHDTATSHCDFTTPHNGHSVRHRYEESALHKKIESWGSKIIVSMPFLRSFAPMGLGSSPAGNCGMGTHVGRQPHEGRIR